MFSSNVRLFFSKPTDNSKSTAELSKLFIEHILNGSSVSFSTPGCTHGVAACSYNIIAHLIMEY